LRELNRRMQSIYGGLVVRPSGVYVINPYCRGLSLDYYVIIVIVLGSGDPPVPTPSLLLCYSLGISPLSLS